MAEQDIAATKNKQAPRNPPDDWDQQVSRILRYEIERKPISYDELAVLLNDLGYEHTQAKHLEQRIKRGAFSAGFFARVLKVLELETLDLKKELKLITRKEEVERRAAAKARTPKTEK